MTDAVTKASAIFLRPLLLLGAEERRQAPDQFVQSIGRIWRYGRVGERRCGDGVVGVLKGAQERMLTRCRNSHSLPQAQISRSIARIGSVRSRTAHHAILSRALRPILAQRIVVDRAILFVTVTMVRSLTNRARSSTWPSFRRLRFLRRAKDSVTPDNREAVPRLCTRKAGCVRSQQAPSD